MNVTVKEDHISIHDGEEEIFYWHKKEWQDDSELIVTVANAIVIALTDPELARETFDRIKDPPKGESE
jgi:hypothetical protein